MSEPENKEQISSIAEDPRDAKIKELEKTLGSQSTELETLRKVNRDAAIMADVIGSNPELVQGFRKVYAQRYQGAPVVEKGEEPSKQQEQEKETKDPANVPNPQFEQTTQRISKVEKTQRAQIIKDFEERAGISSMANKEDRDAMRRSIESKLNLYGQSVETAPVDVLDTVLEDAFKSISSEKAIKDGNFEQFAAGYTTMMGSMPHMSSRHIESESKDELTAGQKKYVKAFGLDEKKVSETYNDRETEATRESEAEKKAKEFKK